MLIEAVLIGLPKNIEFTVYLVAPTIQLLHMPPTFGSIVRNNLLIVLAAAVVLGLAEKFVSEGAVILFGVLYLGQALVNLILGFTHLGSKPGEPGAAPYFLSMLLVLIIGFGACSGIFILAGTLGNMH